MRIFVPIFILLAVNTVFAKPAKKSSKAKPTVASTPAAQVDQVLARYRKMPAVSAKIKKDVVQGAIGTEMKSEGTFYFSKGKLRLEIREPERSLLVFDGKMIWFETPLDETHVHVTKMRVADIKKSNALMAALFNQKDALKGYKSTNVKTDGDKKIYQFVAKDKKKSEVQSLEIVLKDHDLNQLTYVDQVENKVSIEFTDLKSAKADPALVTYKVPRKAEVNEL